MYENLTSLSSRHLYEIDRHVDEHGHITAARVVQFQIQDMKSGPITGLSAMNATVDNVRDTQIEKSGRVFSWTRAADVEMR